MNSADGLFVVDHQHGAAQARPLGRSHALRSRVSSVAGLVGRGRRQQHAKTRALAAARFEHDVAAMLVHDAVHDRQPHAGALAGLLGREERLEDAFGRVGVDAACRRRATLSSTYCPFDRRAAAGAHARDLRAHLRLRPRSARRR